VGSTPIIRSTHSDYFIIIAVSLYWLNYFRLNKERKK